MSTVHDGNIQCAEMHAPDARTVLRLFCFPHAGGDANAFSGWRKELPRTLDVCPILLPGRGRRSLEPHGRQLTTMAAAIAAELPEMLELPFAFYGHSMGALLAFEVARALRRNCGLVPRALLVAGSPGPQCQR